MTTSGRALLGIGVKQICVCRFNICIKENTNNPIHVPDIPLHTRYAQVKTINTNLLTIHGSNIYQDMRQNH